MARIEVCMNATGLDFAPEICSGCDRNFERGERMSAVVSDDGSPLGWYCDECIDDWKTKGKQSRIFEADP